MTLNEAQDLWGALTRNLALRLQDRAFRDWVSPCVPTAYDAPTQTLWVQTPNDSTKTWLEQQMAVEFHEALLHAGLQDIKLAFASGTKKPGIEIPKPNKVSAPPPRDVGEIDISVFPQGFDRYTLENFIVGPNCKFAFDAANGIIDNYGRVSSPKGNPLFIYGATGLGKTHLMVAIGKGLVALHPELRFAYMKVDSFFTEFTSSIRSRTTEPLRQKYQSVDILLLDDIQFLRTMERTQEEIFYIFDYLHRHGKHIVITSDNPPNRLEGLHDRLITRCTAGLIVDLQPPDFETRFAILKKKLEDPVFEDYPSVPEEVLAFIANKAKASVRDLEGLLTRVMFQASFQGMEVSIDVAQQAYKGMTGEEPSAPISLERICKATAEHFDISFNDLIKKKSRHRDILVPRQTAMFLARELTTASYEEIGRVFKMHHSSVMHSIASVKARMQKDPDFHRVIHGLLNSIS